MHLLEGVSDLGGHVVLVVLGKHLVGAQPADALPKTLVGQRTGCAWRIQA